MDILYYQQVDFDQRFHAHDYVAHCDIDIREPKTKCVSKLVSSCKNLSYTERLQKLGLPTLEYRRERADMIQTYKILHGIDNVDKDKLFTMAQYHATRGHSFKLQKKDQD